MQTISTNGVYATYAIIKITAEYLNQTILLYRDTFSPTKQYECFKPENIPLHTEIDQCIKLLFTGHYNDGSGHFRPIINRD